MKKVNFSTWSLFFVRFSIGWLFFYAGYTKLINPEWSAAGYLNGATTFSGFYAWLASPALLPMTNFLNQWGLTLIGIALIIGALTRLSASLGAVMMVLYWFPVLDFPHVEHGFMVDDHVIYALALMYLASVHAGKKLGVDSWLSAHPLMKSHPKLANWLF